MLSPCLGRADGRDGSGTRSEDGTHLGGSGTVPDPEGVLVSEARLGRINRSVPSAEPEQLLSKGQVLFPTKTWLKQDPATLGRWVKVCPRPDSLRRPEPGPEPRRRQVVGSGSTTGCVQPLFHICHTVQMGCVSPALFTSKASVGFLFRKNFCELIK